jgi:putative spermidine/putrescine transport system ATP-binding protein
MTTLEFARVRKTFGPTVALRGFDLGVREGELISLLGPSGCGKTTALRIAAGFDFADSGAVKIAGTDITGVPAHKRNMGMVFQSYSLFPNLTVANNVEFGLRTRKMDAPARHHRVGEMLELVQLTDQADKYPHQLSGGQQQRVALARALAIQPSVLLLDEPLSALDAKVRTSLRDEIRRIQTGLGITTLFVTHDQEEALTISDRIGVMSQGHLEQLGTPTEVYRSPSTAFVARFIGSMNQLPATVVDSHAVQVAGHTVQVGPGHTQGQGSDVTLLVRPEDTYIGDNGVGIPGTVASLSFEGVATTVGVRLDVVDTLVKVHVVGSVEGKHAVGDRVNVQVSGERAVVEATAG